MTAPLLEVSGLHTVLGEGAGAVHAVDGVDFSIDRGETLVLLGESGCGKSMTALSLMRLLPGGGRIAGGSVRLQGVDLLQLPEAAMRRLRGRRMTMIFQEPQSSLNPVLTVGSQIGEALRCHWGLSGGALRERTLALLDSVGIPDPRRRLDAYPHQLSGGMKQRVMIAMALAGEPDLLIADEPTTALDVTIQAQVLALLHQLQQELGMALLLITHDLGVVAEVADRVAVMYAGRLVEQAPRQRFFEAPAHPYSRKLFDSLPSARKRDRALAVIRGAVPPLTGRFPGCRFENRCPLAWDLCRETEPGWSLAAPEQQVRCHLYTPGQAGREPSMASGVEADATAALPPASAGGTLLQVRDLKIHFPVQRGILRSTVGAVRAVDGVSLDIEAGCTLALVGESGCGKTTAGKGILQLIRPTAGRVTFDGEELNRLSGEALRRRRAQLQIIFQDPYASMNPRMTVGEIIAEGLVAQALGGDRSERRRRVARLLEQVGLGPEAASRYPHQFSGGQRQRICIARALAVDPRLIVCDEPTSALDVSVQAQILNLLKELQSRLGIAYLFITHNLSVVEYLAHRVAVMYLGRIVEEGRVEQVLETPRHPYTRALLSAVPAVDPASRRPRIRLQGDMPSPADPPPGCHFHPRCPELMDRCLRVYPGAALCDGGHRVRCHLYLDDDPQGSSPDPDSTGVANEGSRRRKRHGGMVDGSG